MKNKTIINKIETIIVFILLIAIHIIIAGAEKTPATTELQTATTAEKTSFIYTAEFYNEVAEKNNLFKVYDSADLTEEKLAERNGSLIIEKCYGVVTDSKGNGRILLNDNDFINAYNRNYKDIQNDYFYINYSSVEGANEGDIILSYFIYNPDSNYIDDITNRFDYIIDDKKN